MAADLSGLRNRKFHELLAEQAMSPAPTPSWGAALARALQGGVAGVIEQGDEQQQRDALVEAIKIAKGEAPTAPTAQPSFLGRLLGGGSAPAQPAPQASAQQPTTLVGNNPAAFAPQVEPQPKGTTMLPVAGTEDTVPLPKRNPLGALNPEFRSKFADLRTAAGDQGAYFDAPEQGSIGNVRSPQQQLSLYAQGRTAPGPVVTGTTQSNHITGKALDVVPTAGTGEKKIGSVLSSLIATDPRFAGMRSGATFSNLYDPLHVELNKPQGPTQVASLDPSAGVAPQQPPPAQPTAGPQMAQAAPPPQMAQSKPGLNADQMARIEAMARSNNPQVRAMASDALQQTITNSFKPADWDISHRPDGAIVAANKANPNDVRIIKPPGRSEDLIQFNANEKGAEAAAKMKAERDTKNSMPGSFEDASKLRSDVRDLPSYKNVSQAAPIYKTMLETAGRDSKASDLNLVYGLGKIFDPGSVVREGEMVMVKNTASLPDWLVGSINSLNGGARLQPETRKAILTEAHSRMNSYHQMYEQETGMYRGIAESNRVNPDHVIAKFGPFEPWAGPGKAPTADAAPAVKVTSPEEARKLPKGTKITLPDGTIGTVP